MSFYLPLGMVESGQLTEKNIPWIVVILKLLSFGLIAIGLLGIGMSIL